MNTTPHSHRFTVYQLITFPKAVLAFSIWTPQILHLLPIHPLFPFLTDHIYHNTKQPEMK